MRDRNSLVAVAVHILAHKRFKVVGNFALRVGRKRLVARESNGSVVLHSCEHLNAHDNENGEEKRNDNNRPLVVIPEVTYPLCEFSFANERKLLAFKLVAVVIVILIH